ncbi:hypothetical protein MLD38_011147 [Melastoma candidum]|uniref:Uncharacterized protein n=1 Tax=Melastoma candidum TaxID=119954 RepID=A0ACB9R253_9MYRT|nr:hypothetical protein MLD38_011147 [Melastoma candidum]
MSSPLAFRPDPPGVQVPAAAELFLSTPPQQPHRTPLPVLDAPASAFAEAVVAASDLACPCRLLRSLKELATVINPGDDPRPQIHPQRTSTFPGTGPEINGQTRSPDSPTADPLPSLHRRSQLSSGASRSPTAMPPPPVRRPAPLPPLPSSPPQAPQSGHPHDNPDLASSANLEFQDEPPSPTRPRQSRRSSSSATVPRRQLPLFSASGARGVEISPPPARSAPNGFSSLRLGEDQPSPWVLFGHLDPDPTYPQQRGSGSGESKAFSSILTPICQAFASFLVDS